MIGKSKIRTKRREDIALSLELHAHKNICQLKGWKGIKFINTQMNLNMPCKKNDKYSIFSRCK